MSRELDSSLGGEKTLFGTCILVLGVRNGLDDIARVCSGPRLGHDTMCVNPWEKIYVIRTCETHRTTGVVINNESHVKLWHDAR